MIYSSRLKKILQITLEADGYVRVEELAKRLKTSSRTIFRELQHIDEELKEYLDMDCACVGLTQVRR